MPSAAQCKHDPAYSGDAVEAVQANESRRVLALLPEASGLEHLYAIWDAFGAVPVNPVGRLEAPFMHFPATTSREDVWRWFESQNPRFSIGEVLQGLRLTEQGQVLDVPPAPSIVVATAETGDSALLVNNSVVLVRRAGEAGTQDLTLSAQALERALGAQLQSISVAQVEFDALLEASNVQKSLPVVRQAASSNLPSLSD